MSDPNHEQRAFLGWNILTEQAKKRKQITYGEIAYYIGIHPRVVRYLLGPIQDYCLENELPPLTILVVNSDTREPGSGFIAWSRDNLEAGHEDVYRFAWDSIENPFTFAKDGAESKELVRLLIKKPDMSFEVYSKVKVRGMAQKIFKQTVSEIYSNKCAFCEFSQIKALEASHIKKWSACDNNEKIDPRNGLLLCSTHHKLFDNEILFVDEDYIIRVNEKVIIKSEYDRILISGIEGNKIKLPTNKDHWPSMSYFNFLKPIHKK
jgi:putative restriction endonuclease